MVFKEEIGWQGSYEMEKNLGVKNENRMLRKGFPHLKE